MKPRNKPMLAFIAVLLILLSALVLAVLSSIVHSLTYIKKELKKIVMKQEEIDALAKEENASLDKIAQAITDETQEIANWIASQPSDVDISGLRGVASRLDSIAGAVGGIFTAPSTGSGTEGSGTEGSGSSDQTSGSGLES